MSFFESASLVFISDFAAASASMVSGSGTNTGKVYNIKPIKELGSELIVNGDFATDSDWTKVNATISGGTGNLNGTGVTSLIYQSGVLTQNKTYRLTFSVSNYNGLGQLEVINNDGTSYYLATSNGNNIVEFTHAISNQNFLFRARNNAIAEIDNVSVKEVITPLADFDFERGSDITTTRVNSSGLIEKGRGNFLLQSNQFDTTWTLNSTSVTSGQAGYDGSNDAWLLNSTTTGFPRIQQLVSLSGVATYSVYAKAATDSFIQLKTFGADSEVWFNLSSGTIASGGNSQYVTSNIQSVGNGWYRCSATFNGSLTTLRIYPASAFAVYSTSGSGVFIQDAQLEQGLVATDYIETTTEPLRAGLLEDEPRFDYHNSASATPNTCPSLLLEPSRTNLVTQSEYFDDWTNSEETDLSVNNTTSPEGVQNAYSITPQATSNYHRIYNTISVVNGNQYSFSFFAKPNGNNFILFRTTISGSNRNVCFNISNGTIDFESSFADDAIIEDYGNGWYRCSIIWTASQVNQIIYLRSQISTQVGTDDGIDLFTGNGSGAYLYGAQLEEGSYPTSYIPTYGVAAEREAEATSLTYDNNFNDITVFVEVNSLDIVRDTSAQNIQIGNDFSQGGALFLRRSSSTGPRRLVVFFKNNDNSDVFSSYELPEGDSKVAFKYNSTSNACKLFVDGSEVRSGTATDISEFDTFSLNGEGGKFNSKQLVVFNTILSDTDCEILTGATTYSSFAAMAAALNYTVYE